MNPETQTVFMILGALVVWTGTVVAVVHWLNKQFEGVKEFVRTTMTEHKKENHYEHAEMEKEIDQLGLRLVKIEMFSDPRIVPTYPLHGKQ